MRTAIAGMLSLLALPALGQGAPWPELLIDPAARQPGFSADLVLPMPCGGGMAFQRIAVPVDVERPLADRPFRMGQSDPGSGLFRLPEPHAFARGIQRSGGRCKLLLHWTL